MPLKTEVTALKLGVLKLGVLPDCAMTGIGIYIGYLNGFTVLSSSHGRASVTYNTIDYGWYSRKQQSENDCWYHATGSLEIDVYRYSGSGCR